MTSVIQMGNQKKSQTVVMANVEIKYNDIILINMIAVNRKAFDNIGNRMKITYKIDLPLGCK